MTDLKVEYTLLDQTAEVLGGLVSELQNIKAQESAYGAAMGSADVASAMGRFAGNWDYHRRKLVGSMQALRVMVDDTKQVFEKTDTSLKTGLTSKS